MVELFSAIFSETAAVKVDFLYFWKPLRDMVHVPAVGAEEAAVELVQLDFLFKAMSC